MQRMYESMIQALKTSFENKLIDDHRLDSPLFSWNVSFPLFSDKICSFLLPESAFYLQLILILVIQSVINAILGCLLYKIVIEPQQQTPSYKKDGAEKVSKDHLSHNNASPTMYLFALGIALPFVYVQPLYVIDFLGVKNAGLRMGFLATPIVNGLRITEALYGFTPPGARKNLKNYILYFSCSFGISFDTATRDPKKISVLFILKRLKTIGRDFVIASVLISILSQYNYELFETNHRMYATEHSLLELFSWKHLLNNFLVTVLLSTSLSQSSLGVGFAYNLAYGVETYEIVQNPMFKSTSPSEFWGKRWNLLVHQGLKNGVYKPVRQRSLSRVKAVMAAFIISGIIHEYVNLVLFTEHAYQFKWKQMLFFGWNGVLILLEYTVGQWSIFQWIKKNFPPFIVTALVLSSALPLAHLFLGDWIRCGYFDAVSLAEPIVVCSDVEFS